MDLIAPPAEWDDLTYNFEQLQRMGLYAGSGAPAFVPDIGSGSFYFRQDTPTVANQRIYVYNGTSWTGIV